MHAAKPKRRLVRYSLRTMLVVVLVVSVWLGWMANRAAKQRRALALIEELDGSYFYDFELDSVGFIQTDAVPPGPSWLRR